jgi:DNA-binding transcriptional LysR family regulator
MELRHLRYFVAVAEEASFTRAARRLGMAQPPLSQQVARLERTLGVQLFTRTSRGVTLTRAGEALLTEARTLLLHAEETTRVVERVGTGEAGAVRVGAVASAFHGTLVPALRRFREHHPQVLPLVYEMEATPQLEALANRTIDISFMRVSSPQPGVQICALAPEPLVAVLPSSHRLADREVVALEELDHELFALFPRNSAPEAFDAIVHACRRGGFVPDIVYEAPNDHALLGIVAAGLAVSLVPLGTSSVVVPGIAYREVTPACSAATLAAVLPEDTPSPAARHLLEEARQVDPAETATLRVASSPAALRRQGRGARTEPSR